MGCGFSRLPGSRDQHEEDVSLHSIEPFAEHRETVNPDRSREVDQPERETDGPVGSSSDVRIADVSSAQRTGQPLSSNHRKFRNFRELGHLLSIIELSRPGCANINSIK